jgi:2-polyprenyl-3-methyl-5-hydroxy-6-metoxy-1,4-benzoquinol methylase
MKIYSKIKECRICKSRNLKIIIDLKSQYIQGSFIKKNYTKPYSNKIPLKLVFCKKCFLVQLLHTTNKEILYKNYWYLSGINQTMKTHLKKLVNLICAIKRKETKNIDVLDIGCNDGTLLNYFPKSINKYGIDPSQIIKKIDKKKITLINDFFPPKKENLRSLKIKFDLITSVAMFYDVDDPNLFVKNIKYYLKNKGIWVFELSYLVDMLKLNSFDTICHEHLEYYSLQPLNYLMKKNGLKIFNLSRNSINGGSIRCFVTHEKNSIYDKKQNISKIKKLIKNEKKLKINSLYPYKKFYKNILKIKFDLIQLILSIKKQGKSIFVLGASTKGNTILQFLNLNNKIINYAVERNKQKIGAITIGSNIKIISEQMSKRLSPDYYLVLPWHFKNEIVKREKEFIRKGGNLIFPLPKIQIINNKKS